MSESLAEQIESLERRAAEHESRWKESQAEYQRVARELDSAQRRIGELRSGAWADEKIANQREALRSNAATIADLQERLSRAGDLIEAADTWIERVEFLERALRVGHPNGRRSGVVEVARVDRVIEVARLLREYYDVEVEARRMFDASLEARDRVAAAVKDVKEGF